jgi:UDP-N-acetyl-D-galactosamine dehydrogenase
MKQKIAVVGMGYVGLPLALEFGKLIEVIGFDRSPEKILSYKKQVDPANECDTLDFKNAKKLTFSDDPRALSEADYIIIAVPTPVDEAHVPDFSFLQSASELVAKNMKRGVTVIYESTVYPGATEEICIPILENQSSFLHGIDFHVGYSPERVNPGDKNRKLPDIVKVVSGDTPETLERVKCLYELIIKAGVHCVSSIKVAEASKVIENTQRDLNIALINELAIIFERIGIDTMEVLEAAETKWNFLPFRPGLVGGHCIGVDPYYLTHKAEMLGYHPQVILAGRRINDGMSGYVALQAIKMMIQSGVAVKGAVINVLGVTFKENCSDIRNSKVPELINELIDFGCDVYACDKRVSKEDYIMPNNRRLSDWDDLPIADVLILAVPHSEFVEMTIDDVLKCIKPEGILVDIKSVYEKGNFDPYNINVWRL